MKQGLSRRWTWDNTGERTREVGHRGTPGRPSSQPRVPRLWRRKGKPSWRLENSELRERGRPRRRRWPRSRGRVPEKRAPPTATASSLSARWWQVRVKLPEAGKEPPSNCLKIVIKKHLKSSHIIYKETKIIMRVDLLEIMQSRIRTATSLKSSKKKTYNFILHKNL